MKSNTIILIVATLIVASGAYWYFFTGTGNEPPITVVAVDNQAQMQFQQLVSELKQISFDTTLFSDTHFKALIDLTTPVTPETVGRIDPFALVPGVSGK